MYTKFKAISDAKKKTLGFCFYVYVYSLAKHFYDRKHGCEYTEKK